MKTLLKTIMLIDDDLPTNYLNKMVIDEAQCTENVVTVNSGIEALKFLEEQPIEKMPDLIFLDINMPAMNGWEFLDAYQSIPNKKKEKTVIMMLTTSENPDDKMKAKCIKDISGFMIKPLSEDLVENVMGQFFAEDKEMV